MRLNRSSRLLAAALVMLTIWLMGVQLLAAQGVTRVIDERNSLTVTSDSITIQMAGYERTVSRDLWALAAHPRHQHDVWDLRTLVARAEHRGGPIDAPPLLTDDLSDALDELEALLAASAAELEAMRDDRDAARSERDAARDELATLQADHTTLQAEYAAALVRVRGWIEVWTRDE